MSMGISNIVHGSAQGARAPVSFGRAVFRRRASEPPCLFAVLHDKAGLRLDGQKAPVEMFCHRPHRAHPTANQAG